MPQNDDEYNKVMAILAKNMQMNFVKRILTPDLYPRLDLGDGNYATHKMMWGEVNGRPVVFPSVIHQDNALKQLTPDEAFRHAINSKEYIEFNNPGEADWFSKNYKRVWKK